MPGPKLINSPEDMAWLRSVHIPSLPASFRSALICGSEDSPQKILCFESPHPYVTDIPLEYWPDGDGIYICD